MSYQIKLVETSNQTQAFFSSTAMNAFEIPCQNTTIDKDTLSFYVISDYYTYEYQFSRIAENYEGVLNVYSNETEQLLNTFETYLNQETSSEAERIERQEFTFTSNDLKLSGSLWKPKNPINKGLFFVTSSQGNDRSGTNAEAAHFAQLGYTVFNYDKRGTGKSQGNWQSASIEELCSDDMNALQFFSQVSSLSLDDIGIKGSSQGGTKIPYILAKMPELGFGISVSCPSGTLLESDLNSWKNSHSDKIGKANIDQALKVQKAGYDYLAGNIPYETLLEIKNKNQGKDWFNEIWFPEQDVQKDMKLNFSGLPYFEQVTQPVLVIQGLSDQVIPADSYKVIKQALKKSPPKMYEVLTLDNTTHSMTYVDQEFPYFQLLPQGYLPAITDWLEKTDAR